MDYEAMKKAYNNATYQKGSGYEKPEYEKNIWQKPNPNDAYPHLPPPNTKVKPPTPFNPPMKSAPVEVDYSIVKMPDGTYVVARSERLGSLNYDYVCTCNTQHEAREIVRGLNK